MEIPRTAYLKPTSLVSSISRGFNCNPRCNLRTYSVRTVHYKNSLRLAAANEKTILTLGANSKKLGFAILSLLATSVSLPVPLANVFGARVCQM